MHRIRMGVDIGGTKLLLLTEVDGELVERHIPTGPKFSGLDAQAAILDHIGNLPAAPISVGIAIPGLVDPLGQVVACDVLLELVGWKPSLVDLSPAPVVRVINDADAALVAVTQPLPSGATAGVIMVGTAIGAAFQVDGRPLRGACGWAGELGSFPMLTADGVVKLDDLAGGGALVKRLAAGLPVLIQQAEEGDPHVLAAIREAGTHLGIALAGLINLFNPDLLVCAGGAFRWPGYFPAAKGAAEEFSLPDLFSHCSIELSPIATTLVARGALLAGSNPPAWAASAVS